MSLTVRPLPQPSLSSRAFWESGADGVLRMPHCSNCDRWSFPLLPRCPHCGSDQVAMAAASGRATVIGVTVNHQQWLPEMDPPYVIAVVAIAEDDDARLTTNIVTDDPDSIVIGTQVRVVFEQQEADPDIWLPLFEPDPERTEVLPLPPIRDIRAGVRRPATDRRFEHAVALTGVGQSAVGRRLMRDPIGLTVDACLAAIADAGLELSDIDGLSTYPGPGGNGGPGMGEGGIMPLTEALQLKPVWLNGGSDVPGQNGSIIQAMLAVAAGLCRHVLCFRTVWQASEQALVRSGAWHLPASRASGFTEWMLPFGAVSAGNWIAMQASNYSARYGDVRPALGAISVVQRAGASLNPEALQRTPITLDDYYNARMITTPFGLLDCDLPCDGAVAVIVSAVETAADRPNPAVLVEAVGTQVLERLSWTQDTMSHMPQAIGTGTHLWTRTDLTPADVDVACLYDGFTFNALSWIEGLQFCGFGEAIDFIGDGSRISVGGDLPLNPHGGQLSAGRLHGYGFIREAVLQLRGTASNQVPDARVAATSAGGGVPSGAILLRRD